MITLALSTFLAALYVKDAFDRRAQREAMERWAQSLSAEQIVSILDLKDQA